MNILDHTKLELYFGKVEKVDIHEETDVIKKYNTKAGENSNSIVRNLRIYGMLYDAILND